MLTIILQRNKKQGNAIHGSIVLPFTQRMIDDRDRDLTIPTLENADYLIPAGTYPLKRTWSPRFKKELPLIDEVPDREGIRIHMGTKPEHSTGCVLTDFAGLANLNILFNRLEKYFDHEQIELTIRDA